MKYELAGRVNGNAFAVIGYVVKAMRNEKFSQEEIDQFKKDAISNDYGHLLYVSSDMVDKCNERHYSNSENRMFADICEQCCGCKHHKIGESSDELVFSYCSKHGDYSQNTNCSGKPED